MITDISILKDCQKGSCMLWKKKKAQSAGVLYNPETHKAVVRCSICTGEQVAGFKNKSTGQFEEVMLIRNQTDLDQFKNRYHIDEITKEY